jgi:hypothetical protein
MRLALRAAAAALLLLHPAAADALCSGAGVDREYREADVVVRALVVAETRVADDEPSPAWRARWGDYSPVMLHRLRVLEIFKGRPGPAVTLFQEGTSGRFDVDMGSEYLIFLNYDRPLRRRGSAARGAMYVRYACGQSKLWSSVDRRDLARIRTLAAGSSTIRMVPAPPPRSTSPPSPARRRSMPRIS